MKKILFVSCSNLSQKNYSGDSLRAINIIKFLRKKNTVDVISLGNIEKILNEKNNRHFVFKKNHFLLGLFFSLISLIKFEPFQMGFFFSFKIKRFIKAKHKYYNTIIFHLTRSAQYLPKSFKGNKILEMTDLMSNNYNQTAQFLKLYNPLYYLYRIESFLMSKQEEYCRKNFDKIIFVSKKDVPLNNKKFLNKSLVITNGIEISNKKFKFKKNNHKIIFLGNINYLPNKDACLYFVKNILPLINKTKPYLKFYIIGNINFFNKLKFIFNHNVKVLGTVKNLSDIIHNSVCGISSLRIATGVQNKILTYGSFGLPVVCSLKSLQGLPFLKNKRDIFIYKNKFDFVKKINLLKTNKLIADNFSKNIFKKTKKITWNRVLANYNNLV